jgi:hypothetical protein
MTSLIQIVAIVVSTTLLIIVLELVRRRKLTEEYSLVWILCAIALLVLSTWRRSLDVIALWLGIYYPPALLILVLAFFMFVASLSFSLVISRQREQIERLIEEVAILSAVQRDLQRLLDASPTGNSSAPSNGPRIVRTGEAISGAPVRRQPPP